MILLFKKQRHAVLVFNHNRVFCTDAFYPCGKRGSRAQRAGVSKNLRGRKSVRADRRLRTDEKAIRAQTAIVYKKQRQAADGFNHNRVFRTDAVYPCGKRGSRAQRAGFDIEKLI